MIMKNGMVLLAMMLLIVSCRSIEELTPNVVEETIDPGIHMTMPAALFDAQTKVSISSDEGSGLSFFWSAGDETGVYGASSGFACFSLTVGAGLANATFDGGDFSLTNGVTYYAFYPYIMSATDKTAITLDYSGQSITTDGGASMDKAYMWSSAVASGGNASFSFAHIGAFLRLKMKLTAGMVIDKVEIIPLHEAVPQQMSFNIATHETPAMSTSSPIMTITTTGLTVPAGDVATVWAVMPPKSYASDDLGIVIYSGANTYSYRVPGSAFNAGKAYRKAFTPVAMTDPGFGFTTVTETDTKDVTAAVGAGQYSGITYMGGTQYAVINDDTSTGGIVFYNFSIDNDGKVGEVIMSAPVEPTIDPALDNEGIAFMPGDPSGTLWVSAEADQTIREYGLDGKPTGKMLTIPEDLASDKIQSNKGFEALTYNDNQKLFWTTTEYGLQKDDVVRNGLLRLQSFGTDRQPAARYLYQMDGHTVTDDKIATAYTYVHGVPALAALDDGRVIVLEREVYVPGNYSEIMTGSFTKMKLYVVKPSVDDAGILRKTLMTSFSTNYTNAANYEGMCVGPDLSDGRHTLVLIPDSQNGSSGLTKEYVKVISFK